MKICFFTKSVFNLGGVQRVVSVISNELSKNHDITILCDYGKYNIDRNLYNLNDNIEVIIEESLAHKKVNFFKRATYKSIKVINSKGKCFEKASWIDEIYYPKTVRNKLIKFFNSKNYDVIIGVEGYYSMMLALISNKLNSKVMGWQHNSYEAYFNTLNCYYWGQKEIFKRNIPNLEYYFVLNEYDQQRFKEDIGINCEVIYNPVSFFCEDKSKLIQKTFLAAGRFNKQKGFDLLIESFNIFSKKNDEWKLIIVGEGEDKDEIESLIRAYRLENRIELKPFTNEIKKYFLQSSILTLSSRWEGMPMIALEALVMGVPIIAYDITAMKPIVDNEKEGIIVEKYNVKLFAEAMEKLSESYCLRKKMAVNAIKKSEKFNIENIVRQWECYFSEI